ncbi:putative Ig domain-containing protein [Nitrosomonas sp. JL21]|uniref:putative Ig domain-containing protein n=1 Tax=Nitrosomonas sp. JL21 TaxID=153949 RepID=UPI0023DC885B|nr:putative Ig domain-containing protein [Nitrosomonas sp. JL21]
MSPSQAAEFTKIWRVSAQYIDPLTGVSATVFESSDGTKCLAIRGTELEDKDLLADGILASALPAVLNPQYAMLQFKLNAWLNDPNILQGQTFTVTGHSLGGYLAAAIKQNFPQVTEAYLFNAPGVGGLMGNLADVISDVFGLNTIDESNIWNLRGSEGFPIIASLGYQLGSPVNIQTEASNNNHSIVLLTDALAVYSTYSQLLPDQEIQQMSTLIDAFGSTKDIGGSNAKTLESAVDALRTILINPENGKIVLGENHKTSIDNRDQFYAQLNNETFKNKLAELADNVELTPFFDLSTNDILSKLESNDQQGLATRFALVALNPFILEGETIDYEAFNTYGALELFDLEAGAGTLTSSYIIDRLTMLIRKNWFNIEDKNPLDSTIEPSSSNHRFQNINDYSEDVTSGYKISQGELTNKTPRYFFGGDSWDSPAASAVEDHFYGGEGDDMLKGLKGNDYLEGGSGLDTYMLNPGDGTDTILDTDGMGVVEFGGTVARGKSGVTDRKDWIKMGDSWIDQKNDLIYLRAVQDNGNSDLFISYVGANDSARVRIKNWSNGQFGITLGENAQPESLMFDRIILGDLEPEKPTQYDEFDNLIVTEEEDPDREDMLFGSAENDHIRSLGGNDEVDGKDGKDRIEGGAGEDVLAGGKNDDLMLGGTDSDIISGQQGNDRLYAETEFTLDDAYILGKTQTGTGKRGDLLDGGLGKDILMGNAGNDILMGGLGEDVLVGLGGDDMIEGDVSFGLVERNWNITQSVNTVGNTTHYSRFYNFNTVEIGGNVGDDDVIYSSTGKDWIFAQGGNDFIDAGADDDVAFGEAGNDTLLGQAGNDKLFGDNSPNRLNASLHGDDYLDGGNGKDELLGNGGSDYLLGGADNDLLIGDAIDIPLVYQGDDVFDGGAGDDVLSGGGGNDTLDGGEGNDVLLGGVGDDTYLNVEEGDVINDLNGHSIIVLADTSLALDNPESEEPSQMTWLEDSSTLRITQANGGILDLKYAMYGMNAQIQFNGSNSVDMEAWISENLHEPVILNLSSLGVISDEPINQAYGGADDDLLQGSTHDDSLRGHGGNDYLLSGNGNDLIDGGVGDDALFGEAGNDTLQGGSGEDRYTGGSGADSYIFNRGDGGDTITATNSDDASGDEVHFGAGITTADLRFFQLANGDLLLRIADTQDSLLFKEWFTQGPNITALRFSDGTMMSVDEINMLATGILGGTIHDDTLVGTVADDHIEGYAGNDILDGRSGNDLLVGGEGEDTYLFGWNSQGNDIITELAGSNTIALEKGTVIADLRHAQYGDDLIISLRGSTATLTLKDYYLFSQQWSIRVENNVMLDMAEWLALPEPAIDLEQLEADFLETARTQWANSLLNNEYYNNLGSLEAINPTTYHAESVSTYETKIDTHHFTIVNTTADTSFIQRQSNSESSSSTRIDLLNPNPADTADRGQEPPSEKLLFVPVHEWAQLYKEPVSDIEIFNGMTPVYDTYNLLVGFILDFSFFTTPKVVQNHWQTHTTTNAQVEHIQGGDSDNVIIGYKHGDDYQYSNGNEPSDSNSWNEVSIIDGGNGNDTLYASGKIHLNSEVYYYTDTSPKVGGFLYGNNGNDNLYGNHARDTLIGGDGDDVLDGGFSQDSYFMFAGEVGIDVIWDTGAQIRQSGSFFKDEVNIGLNYTLEPKPIAQDTLRLVGINPGDISFTWGERMVGGIREIREEDEDLRFVEALHTQTTHATLTLSWTGGGVEIVLPNSTDLPGFGLERIQLDNGNEFTMAELIDFAHPTSTLNPQNQDNVLAGQDSNDVLYGEGGNDTLMGGQGDDILAGGSGNDTLTGGPGNDSYLFDQGFGKDTVNNHDTTTEEFDYIEFGHGISADKVRASRSGDHLVLTVLDAGDELTVLDYFADNGVSPSSVEEINFSDEDVTWDLAAIMARLETNHAPELSIALPDQKTILGSTFNYAIDSHTFTDPDAVDNLSYSALLSNGGALPAWLHFDASTQTFIGTPDTPGILNVTVTAKDNNDLTVSDTFTLTIQSETGILRGTSGSDILKGESVNDILYGFAGDDTLSGNAGDDRLNGGSGNDTLIGGSGNDKLSGGKGRDLMLGGVGNDVYRVDNANDLTVEYRNEGIDRIFSTVTFTLGKHFEHLTLTGTSSIDATGNDLPNIIVGNNSANRLFGGTSNDTLDGKGGKDELIGGSGKDIFKFTQIDSIDTITDFSVRNDTLKLDNAVFTALSHDGSLPSSSFKIGNFATDADDYILYNAATGALRYDADGNGATAAIHFATLSAGLALTHTDIVII